jgi:hypothetical protein
MRPFRITQDTTRKGVRDGKVQLGRTGVQLSPICLGTMSYADPTPEEEKTRGGEVAPAPNS